MGRHTFGPPRLLLCVVATTCLGACSGGLERSSSPCPSGQDLREERHDDATSIKSRGCVGPDSENNYRRQGHWEFFHPNGQKEAEGSYVDGNQGGAADRTGILIDGREGAWAFWHENGQKSAEVTNDRLPRRELARRQARSAKPSSTSNPTRLTVPTAATAAGRSLDRHRHRPAGRHDTGPTALAVEVESCGV